MCVCVCVCVCKTALSLVVSTFSWYHVQNLVHHWLTKWDNDNLKPLQYIYTGWNDKIVALEKTTWFYFRWMKTGFLFLLQTIYWLASRVQIPRAIGAFYHVCNVQRARSEMRRRTTHALYRSKLWQQNHRWIPTNNRGVPRVMKTKFPAMVMVLGVVSSEGHILPPQIFEVGLKVM